MTTNFDRQTKKTARGRSLFLAALVLGCGFGAVTQAAAQGISSPTTPAAITPPAGNFAYVLGRGVGTQGYVCLPQGTGASWTVNGARPEATLFQKVFGQTWRSSPTSLAPIQTPISSRRTHWPSATRRGRVPSIAARCGRRRWDRSPPAPTRAARTPARLAASCCRSSARTEDRRAVGHWSTLPSFSA
jgi:Protein of unknown function (DUF3455)